MKNISPPHPKHSDSLSKRWRVQIIVIILDVAFYAFVLFYAAREIIWPIAWFYLISYLFYLLSSSRIGLKAVDPDPRSKEKRTWDKLLTLGYRLTHPLTLALAGIEFRQFNQISLMPSIFQVIGGLVLCFAFGMTLWAQRENPYYDFSMPTANQWAQDVITKGPYELIRHPGYMSSFLLAFARPMMLGSIWALIPGMVGAGVILLQTHLEDHALRKGVDGYELYTRSVRYRLFQSIW